MSPHIPDKGLISKIYKKLLQHNSQNLGAFISNMQGTWIESCLQKTYWKRSLISLLIIRDMKIKHTMTYHFTPVRMIVIRKTRNPSESWWGCVENKILLPITVMVNGSTVLKNMKVTQKLKNRNQNYHMYYPFTLVYLTKLI